MGTEICSSPLGRTRPTTLYIIAELYSSPSAFILISSAVDNNLKRCWKVTSCEMSITFPFLGWSTVRKNSFKRKLWSCLAPIKPPMAKELVHTFPFFLHPSLIIFSWKLQMSKLSEHKDSFKILDKIIKFCQDDKFLFPCLFNLA